MKAIELVLKNNGSNVGTYSPYMFLETFNGMCGNIDERTMRCLSYDDDRQVETSLFTLTTVNLPEWMSEQYYLNNHVAFHWAMALTSGWAGQLNKEMFTKFITLDETYEFFIGWLFKGKTKSTFKLDIRSKVLEWLASDSYQYKQPLSHAQFETASKYCPLYEAKQISNRLYYSNAYWNKC